MIDFRITRFRLSMAFVVGSVMNSVYLAWPMRVSDTVSIRPYRMPPFNGIAMIDGASPSRTYATAKGRSVLLEMPDLVWLRAPIVVPAIEIAYRRIGQLRRVHIIEPDQTDGIECCAIKAFALAKNSDPACGAESVMHRTTCKLVIGQLVRSRLHSELFRSDERAPISAL